MGEKEHLSESWVRNKVDIMPWLKPLLGEKIRKIELRSYGFQYEEGMDQDE